MVRIGILTDSHLCPPGTPPDGCHNPYAYDRAESILATALADLLADAVDVIAVLGDLSNGGDADSLERAVRVLAASPVPLWIVGGNHDRDVNPAFIAEMVDRHRAGLIMHGGLRYCEGIAVAALPISSGSGAHDWRVAAPAIAEWPAEPVLLLSHFPVVSRAEAIIEAGFKYVGSFVDDDAILPALMDRAEPTVVLHGHLHLRDAYACGPVLQIGCASLIEPPHERAVLDLDIAGQGLTVRVSRSPVIPSPVVRIPALVGTTGHWAYRQDAWVAVPEVATPTD